MVSQSIVLSRQAQHRYAAQMGLGSAPFTLIAVTAKTPAGNGRAGRGFDGRDGAILQERARVPAQP
jgi:hypothetical protein